MSLSIAEPPIWSKSQLTALKECARKFAISQKAPRDASTDPIFADATFLKKLKNRHLWTGSAIHDAIGLVLKSVRQGEPLPASPEFISALKTQLREKFKLSKEMPNGSSIERLFEHEYNVNVSADVWRGHWETIEKAATWFLSSKWAQRLASLEPQCWKAVDELLQFDVNGVKAFLKVDCAIEKDNKIVIIDWTTSSSLQSSEPGLLVAALYAHEVWGAEPENIEAMAVSVLDGKSFHANVHEESLMNTHLRIEEEAMMLEEARQSIGGNPFDTPMTENLDQCRKCNFQRLCHPKGIGYVR